MSFILLIKGTGLTEELCRKGLRTSLSDVLEEMRHGPTPSDATVEAAIEQHIDLVGTAAASGDRRAVPIALLPPSLSLCMGQVISIEPGSSASSNNSNDRCLLRCDGR